MVALACNLYFVGPRFFTGLTAVFVAGWHCAPAWQVGAFVLLVGSHHFFPLFQTPAHNALWRNTSLSRFTASIFVSSSSRSLFLR